MGFGKVAQILRASLTATMASPDLTLVLLALGKAEILKRIEKACN